MRSTKALWDLMSLVSGELLSKIAGFVAFAYLARNFSAESYGTIEFAFGLFVFFSSIVEFGYGPIGAREVATSPEKRSYYASTIFSSRILWALLCLPLMNAMAWLMDVTDSTRQMVMIVSVGLLAVPFNCRWLLQGMEKMAWVSLAQAIRMAVFLVGVLIFVHTASSVLVVGVIEVAGGVAVALYFLWFQYLLGVKLQTNFKRSDIAAVTSKAKAIGLGQVVWSFNQNLPTVLIVWFVGPVELAWYGAALRIVNALASFSMLYHFNIYPTVVRRLGKSQEDYRQFSEPSVRICAWSGLLVAYVGVLLAVPLCEFAFGEKYALAALPLSILIWTIPFALLSGHARWALIASDKQKYVMVAQMSGCITSIIVGLLLIPEYHAVGGSIAMVSSALVVWLVAHYFACRHVTKIPVSPVFIPFCLVSSLLLASWLMGLAQGLFVIIPIAAFILLAPLVDSRLLRDIPTLMRIKSESP